MFLIFFLYIDCCLQSRFIIIIIIITHACGFAEVIYILLVRLHYNGSHVYVDMLSTACLAVHKVQ